MSNDERNEFPLTNSQPNFKSNTIYTSREGATDATSMKTNFAIDAANRTVRNADKNKVFYNTGGFNVRGAGDTLRKTVASRAGNRTSAIGLPLQTLAQSLQTGMIT